MRGSALQNVIPESRLRFQHLECPVCTEKLGTHGGPCSLACGHNGCLQCLQQVQSSSIIPVCPLCQTPFVSEAHLAPNLVLKDALERLDAAGLCLGLREAEQTMPHAEYPDGEHLGVDIPMPVYPSVDGLEDGSSNACDANKAAKNSYLDVSYWSVAKGILAMLTGRTKQLDGPNGITCSLDLDGNRFNDGDLGGDRLGDIWSSVYLPSAPPFPDVSVIALLEAEPPQWVSDSACRNCMQCKAKFQPLTRGRHHCRFCGGIFCGACSAGRCLLPVKFMQRDLQRVCDECYSRLESIQHYLVPIISNAAQIAIHDVTDRTCSRGWLNNPVGLSMQEEIYKATSTLRSFCKIGKLRPERSVPEAVLRGAKGLAILTVMKVGMVVTYKFGTGLMVARRDDGSWSPPTAVVSCGLGWGLQAGGELVDFVVILPSIRAVKAFSSGVHISMGAGLSASAGPLGRLAEADLRVGNGGVATCYTYSCSQGAFVGLSLEGNIVAARTDTNAHFYGDPYLTPEEILFGHVPVPEAAAPLYGALQDLFFFAGTRSCKNT